MASGPADAVGRPRVVEHHPYLRLAAESPDCVLDLATHRVERRAPHERGGEVDVHVLVLHANVLHDAEVDDRDHGDLRVGDLPKRSPDRVGRK